MFEPEREFEEEVRLCKEYALRLLTRQDYTRYQLIEKLSRKWDEQAAQEAVDRMEELGLVNDRSYAMRCARDLVRLRAFAPRRVAQELRHRGIGDAELEEAVAQFDGADMRENIARILRKKHAVVFENPDEKQVRRAVAALQRLGYTYEDVRYVIENPDEFAESV